MAGKTLWTGTGKSEPVSATKTVQPDDGRRDASDASGASEKRWIFCGQTAKESDVRNDGFTEPE